jgi:transposase
VRKDETDARHLADLLRLGMLPEAWLAPAEVRELRERVRHRAALVAWRSSVRAHVHAVPAKEGIAVSVSDLFGKAGREQLSTVRLAPAYQDRIEALLRLHEVLDGEVETAMAQTRRAFMRRPEYAWVQQVPGVGPVLGAVFVAEIGEVSRFGSAAAICCWAGLTPKHRESDTTVRRGRITKQGAKLVRWAAIEAVHHLPRGSRLLGQLGTLARRRGHNVAATAVARKLLVLVYYAMRDGGLRGRQRQVA